MEEGRGKHIRVNDVLAEFPSRMYVRVLGTGFRQDRQCTYDVTLRCVYEAVVAVEKQ